MKTKFFRVILVTFMALVLTTSGCGSSSGNISSGSSSEICTICGGKLVCAICGKSGLYCENASYGAGDDHYCSTHWSDVVEWHNNK